MLHNLEYEETWVQSFQQVQTKTFLAFVVWLFESHD